VSAACSALSGAWDVRSPDGRVGATGITVGAGGAQSDGLVDPIGGSEDLSQAGASGPFFRASTIIG
jgi:hypothetical protein